MSQPEFNPGFRFSELDGVGIVVGAIAAYWVSDYISEFADFYWGRDALLPLMLMLCLPLGAFFIFCNVFRVGRTLELIWAAAYLVFFICSIIGRPSGWWFALLLSVSGVALAVFAEMLKPSYHGVFWRQINPGLPQWWKEHNEQPLS